jgi:ankyrin repeat protein
MGNISEVRRLLEEGADINEAIDVSQGDSIKDTPLSIAVAEGNDKVVDELLKHNELDVNKMPTNSLGKTQGTPLLIAIEHARQFTGKREYINIVRSLLRDPRTDKNKGKHKYDLTPLHNAVFFNLTVVNLSPTIVILLFILILSDESSTSTSGDGEMLITSPSAMIPVTLSNNVLKFGAPASLVSYGNVPLVL